MYNYSFWADEAGLASIISRLLSGNVSLNYAFHVVEYQKLHMLLIALFFKFFGESEFIARLPSIILFLVGIPIIFILAKKIGGIHSALLSTVLYTFSQLNLAYATQAKQAIHLEVLLLFQIWLITMAVEANKPKKIALYSLTAISTAIVATSLHYIGVLLWIPYIIYLLSQIWKYKFFKRKANALTYIAVVSIITIVVAILYRDLTTMLLAFFGSGHIFTANHLYQVIKLFFYKYAFITMCAFLGFMISFKKNQVVHWGIVCYGLVLFILVTFKQYIFNIRYVLPLFGILFLYFGVFWAKVGERFDSNFKFLIFNFKVSGKSLIPIVVMLLIYITGYKVVRGPQAYYNPNIDKYGDVQIANYKDFYLKLKERFPNYMQIAILNDNFDTEYWYMKRYSNAYFMKSTPKPHKHAIVDATVYGSLDDFKRMIKSHPQGLFIMEDWQSFLPEDIKEYAKKNLQLEFRIESLREAPNDPWPLALYSWGFEEK